MRARIGDAAVAEHLGGEPDRAVGLERLRPSWNRVPARDGEQPVRREPVEEGVPRLGRVQRVLAQREGAGRGRRPRVDERDLDEVVAVLRPRQVAARLVVDERDARIAVEVPREVAVNAVGDRQDVRVDLDPGDRALAELERREDVAAAADADHENGGVVERVVREVRDVVAEEVRLRRVACVAREHRRGVRVDAHDFVLGAKRAAASSSTARRHRPRRSVAVRIDGDAREGVPLLVSVRRVGLALGPYDAQQRVTLRVEVPVQELRSRRARRRRRARRSSRGDCRRRARRRTPRGLRAPRLRSSSSGRRGR